MTIDYHDWAWNDAYIRCSAQGDRESIAWLKDHIVDDAARHLRESEALAKLLFGREIVQILLIHGGAFDAVMLDAILKDFRAKGVTFVALDEALAQEPAYRINPNRAYQGGRTFLEQIAEARKIDADGLADETYSLDGLGQICKQKPAAKVSAERRQAEAPATARSGFTSAK